MIRGVELSRGEQIKRSIKRGERVEREEGDGDGDGEEEVKDKEKKKKEEDR